MSSAEKKYFKQYAARYATDYVAVYMQLFDTIDQQTVYDEAPLRAYLPAGGQLSVYKHYLLNLLLDCLVAMPQHQHGANDLLRQIARYTILEQKKLHKQLPKRWATIAQLVQQHQLYGFMDHLFYSKIQYTKILDNRHLAQQEQAIIAEAQAYLELQKNYWDYYQLREQVIMLCNSRAVANSDAAALAQLQQLQQHALLQSVQTARHPHSLLYFYESHLFCDYHLNTTEQSYWRLRAFLMEQNQQLGSLQYNEQHYFFALSRFLQVCWGLHYITDMSPVLELLSATVFVQNNTAFLAQNCLFQYRLLCFSMGAFDDHSQVLQWWHTHQTWWSLNEQKLSNTTRNLHRLNLIRVFFILRRWRVTLQLVHELATAKIHHSQDADVKVRFLWLMVQYEMDNISLLDYLSDSVKSWLTRRQQMGVSEKIMLRFFHKISSTPDKHSRHRLFVQLKKRIDSQANDPDLDYFVLAWLQCHVDKQTIEQSLRAYWKTTD